MKHSLLRSWLLALVLGLALPQAAQAQVNGWIYPTGTSAVYNASSSDNGKGIGPDNVGVGTNLTVNLPSPGAVATGYEVFFGTGNGKGFFINAPGGVFILAGQKTLTSLTVPSNTNYEYLAIISDGVNYRLKYATRATVLMNGITGDSGGEGWTFLFTTGYSATAADNGHTLSDATSGAATTITLPSTGNVPTGWVIGVYQDLGNQITLVVNGVSGGTIIPINGVAGSTYSLLANVTRGYAQVQFDGANFRVLADTTLALANTVPSNAALLASCTASAGCPAGDMIYPNGVWRNDFAVGNGAPPLFYKPQNSACSISGGNGDNGLQVKSADSKCWIASPSSESRDIRQWGATTAASDNAVAVQAAFGAAVLTNGCVYVPNGVWKVGSQITATLASANISACAFGDGPDASVLQFTTGGGILVNRNHAQSAVHFRDLWVQTQGVNAGIGIDVEGGNVHNSNTASSTFDRIKASGDVIGGGTPHYWGTGIKLNGISQVNINSVDIWGDSTGGGSGSNATGIDLEAVGGANCSTNCSFITNITNSNLFGSKRGLIYGANVQGVTVTNTNFTLNFNGIYLPPASAQQSQLTVSSSQFDNIGDNILLDTGGNSPQIMINNNLFFLTASTSGFRAKGTPSWSQFIGNQCSTTTGALLTANCLQFDNASGTTAVANTVCVWLTTCVLINSPSTGIQVSNTVFDPNVGTGLAVINNATTLNTVRGFINPNFLAQFYPQGAAISAVANNGSGLVRLTVASTAVFTNGEVAFVNAPGVGNSPGLFQINIVNGTTIDLVGSSFGGVYTGGGALYILP